MTKPKKGSVEWYKAKGEIPKRIALQRGRLWEIRTKEQAKKFLEEYKKYDPLNAEANMRYFIGYYSDSEQIRLRRLFGFST